MPSAKQLQRVARTRALRFEHLEQRRVLSADVFHNLAFPLDVNDDLKATPVDVLVVINHLNASDPAPAESESEAAAFLDVNNDAVVSPRDALGVINHINGDVAFVTELATRLRGDGPESGAVEYELESEDGRTKREFEVELEHSTPDSVQEVTIDGVPVGLMTVNDRGHGKLKLTDYPDEVGELPLPDDFPAVAPGSVVAVGAVASGTLNATEVGPDNGHHDGPDDDGAQEHDDEGALRDGVDDEHGERIELAAWLRGDGPASGEVEYELESEDGRTKREFEVELEHSTPGSVHEVTVDGVPVGWITVNDGGHGKLTLTDHPDEDSELPFPDDFPAVGPGWLVLVGDVVSGVLGAFK